MRALSADQPVSAFANTSCLQPARVSFKAPFPVLSFNLESAPELHICFPVEEKKSKRIVLCLKLVTGPLRTWLLTSDSSANFTPHLQRRTQGFPHLLSLAILRVVWVWHIDIAREFARKNFRPHLRPNQKEPAF